MITTDRISETAEAASVQNTLPVILCGGKGSRLSEMTNHINKPLIDIGGAPIVLHVAYRYWVAGFRKIALAAGWQFDAFNTMFTDYLARLKDHPLFGPMLAETEFLILDTGPESDTFERIVKTKDTINSAYYFVTYGDTITDIDCASFLDEFNQKQVTESVLMMSAVQPEKRFSSIEFNNDLRVTRFTEKQGREPNWVGCGFIILSHDHIEANQNFTSLEREFLPHMTLCGHVYLFQHMGLWQPMDYLIDVKNIQRIYNDALHSGRPQWLQ